MHFVKMEGLSNDFIVTHDTLSDTGELCSKLQKNAGMLCDRRRGIGADGIICILPSSKALYQMRIFNSDGSEAEMCGNGIRCFALYLEQAGLHTSPNLSIETLRGIISTTRFGNDIQVDMGSPILDARLIPTIKNSGHVLMEPIDIDGKTFLITAVSMGNPHAVIYVDEITDKLVLHYGKKLESHPFFPKHANIGFVKVLSDSEIQMRVYERGCGETWACGTNACACIVSGVLNKKHGNTVLVHLLGGDLRISWDGNENHSVFMTGPARDVFKGSIDL